MSVYLTAIVASCHAAHSSSASRATAPAASRRRRPAASAACPAAASTGSFSGALRATRSASGPSLAPDRMRVLWEMGACTSLADMTATGKVSHGEHLAPPLHASLPECPVACGCDLCRCVVSVSPDTNGVAGSSGGRCCRDRRTADPSTVMRRYEAQPHESMERAMLRLM